MAQTIPGEEKAWDILSARSPEEVCRNAVAYFDRNSKTYSLKSFGKVFTVNSDQKRITCLDEGGYLFLGRLAYFFRLSLLWYLAKATDTEPSGKLVKPSSMTGGDIFFRGTHVLPTEAVAEKYARAKEEFINRGLAMGGQKVEYGDAAVELFPFHKIPVTVILWLEDEEFASRTDLLFDASCTSHLPLDILWSVAMMSLLVFL